MTALSHEVTVDEVTLSAFGKTHAGFEDGLEDGAAEFADARFYICLPIQRGVTVVCATRCKQSQLCILATSMSFEFAANARSTQRGASMCSNMFDEVLDWAFRCIP